MYVALGTRAHHSLFSVDPRLTLTYFTTRLNLGVCVFEWDKLLNGHLMGKKLVANDQND